MITRPLSYYLKLSGESAEKFALENLEKTSPKHKVIGVAFSLKPSASDATNSDMIKAISDKAKSLFPKVKITTEGLENAIALTLPIQHSDELKVLTPLCHMMVNNLPRLYVKDMYDPGWLPEFIALQKRLPSFSRFHMFHEPVELSVIIDYLKMPSYMSKDDKRYEEQEATLRKAILSGYAEDGFISDMSNYLFQNWNFDSLESAHSFIQEVMESAPRKPLGQSVGGFSPYMTLYQALIQEKLNTDTYSEKVDNLFDKVSDEFKPTNKKWIDSLNQITMHLGPDYDGQCVPRHFDEIKERYSDSEYQPRYVKFTGFDASCIAEINFNHRLRPDNIAISAVEQGTSPKRSLLGEILTFLNYVDEVKTDEYLYQGIMEIADNALSESPEEIERQFLVLGESFYEFDPTQYAPLKSTHKMTP